MPSLIVSAEWSVMPHGSTSVALMQWLFRMLTPF
jgi:hypothetical protein